MADTSTTAMFACISTFRSNVSSYEGTMLHELILTPMTSIVTVITLIISSFVYAKYRCVWKTMIVITVILLAGAFIYWMSAKENWIWTLAVGPPVGVIVAGWGYARNISSFIGVIRQLNTGRTVATTQLRRLLSWTGFCKGYGSKGTSSDYVVWRDGQKLHIRYSDGARADDIGYKEKEIVVDIEHVEADDLAGAVKTAIRKRIQELVGIYYCVENLEKNAQVSEELVHLFRGLRAFLMSISNNSVHFFVLVKVGPDHDAFLQACTDGTLLRGLGKVLITPELEQTAGCKLRVKMEVKDTSAKQIISTPADRWQTGPNFLKIIRNKMDFRIKVAAGFILALLTVLALLYRWQIGPNLLEIIRNKMDFIIKVAAGFILALLTALALLRLTLNKNSTESLRTIGRVLVTIFTFMNGFLKRYDANESRHSVAGNISGSPAKSTDDEKVNTDQLYRFSRVLPDENIMSLIKKLGDESVEAQRSLDDEGKDERDVLRKTLSVWYGKSGLRGELLSALQAIGLQKEDPVVTTLTTRCEGTVEQGQLQRISQNCKDNTYLPLSKALGIRGNEANSILRKNLGDRQESTMENLMTWKNRTCGPCTDLEYYLITTGAGGKLVDIIRS